MSPTAFQAIASGVQSIVTSIALGVGGGWTLWRFVLQRENVARLENDLEFRLIGPQEGRLLIEIAAVIENKGKVRHWVKDFYFNLYCLRANDPLIENTEHFNGQPRFGERLQNKRGWFPADWVQSFIEPGVKQRYTFTTSIPADATSVLLYSEFRYSDSERGFHTSQRVFAVSSPLLSDGQRILPGCPPTSGTSRVLGSP